MGRRGGHRLRPRGPPRDNRHYSRPRDRQRRRVRERRPTDICDWLREHRRRSCALHSAAGLLRAHALRPTTAPERQRVRQLQRPVDQRRRLQLGRCRSLAESHPQADEFRRWWVARTTWFPCNARALLIVDHAQMRLRPDKVAISPTDHGSHEPRPAALTTGSRPIRMSGSIGRRVEDLSARLTDLALLLVGTPARERQRTRGATWVRWRAGTPQIHPRPLRRGLRGPRR